MNIFVMNFMVWGFKKYIWLTNSNLNFGGYNINNIPGMIYIESMFNILTIFGMYMDLRKIIYLMAYSNENYFIITSIINIIQDLAQKIQILDNFL